MAAGGFLILFANTSDDVLAPLALLVQLGGDRNTCSANIKVTVLASQHDSISTGVCASFPRAIAIQGVRCSGSAIAKQLRSLGEKAVMEVVGNCVLRFVCNPFCLLLLSQFDFLFAPDNATVADIPSALETG